MEYLYIDAGSTNFLANPFSLGLQNVAFEHRFHLARAGLNYRFGGDESARASLVHPVFNWSGFYVGGTLGAGISTTQVDAIGLSGAAGSTGLNQTGFSGGAQAGFNVHLAPQWVAGIEGDINYLGIDRRYASWDDANPGFSRSFGLKTDAYGTIRGRLGYSTGPSLLYVTGGAAFVRLENSLTLELGNIRDTVSKTASGWTVGGGIETALGQQWSAKLEYLYIDAGRTDTVAQLWDGRFDNKFQIVRAGVNYRLGQP
jgi:outer membrane immunogenic protein